MAQERASYREAARTMKRQLIDAGVPEAVADQRVREAARREADRTAGRPERPYTTRPPEPANPKR